MADEIGNDIFKFPLDAYPKAYTGPTQEYQGFLSGLLPQFQTTLQDLPAQTSQFYNQSRDDITKGFDTAIKDVGKTYQNTLQPALQNTFNSLGKRGMLNSSVAGNALSGTAKGLGSDVMAQQSQLNLAKQLALAQMSQQGGESMYKLPQLLSELLSQGSYSEQTDTSVPYTETIRLLTSLMGY